MSVAEHEKYVRAYRRDSYRMGPGRMEDAVKALSALPARGSYLDVGCGRGEMLKHAKAMGFAYVAGVEVVPYLCGDKVKEADATSLPFGRGAFDVVSMFDVIEHLLAGEDETACKEIARVAKYHAIIAANSCRSALPDGTELHVNRRPREEWDKLFRCWFAPGRVTLLDGLRAYPNSPCWRVDF